MRARLIILAECRFQHYGLSPLLDGTANLTPTTMKSQDARKETKKLPTMTTKERKEAKRLKKAGKR